MSTAPATRDLGESPDDDVVYRKLVEWLIAKVAGYVNSPEGAIGLDTPLADLGIDSVTGLALCADLAAEWGVDVDATIVWDYPTITELAAHLVRDQRPS